MQTAPKRPAQVVGDAAGADHQHSLIGERSQGGTERELGGRALAGHEGQRQHRNIGVRVQVAQDGPDAVVQSAIACGVHGNGSLGQ